VLPTTGSGYDISKGPRLVAACATRLAGELMPRSMVGLLAAVSVAMPALVTFTHGVLAVLAIVDGAAGAGLVAYLALPPIKKIFRVLHLTYSCSTLPA